MKLTEKLVRLYGLKPAASSYLRSKIVKVTPLSKFIALTLFIALPFFGFYLGMEYQKLRNIVTASEKSYNRGGSAPKTNTQTYPQQEPPKTEHPTPSPEFWPPICDKEHISDSINVEVEVGYGLTNIARKGLEYYLVTLMLDSIPNSPPYLSA